jgi:hypothetical protein
VAVDLECSLVIIPRRSVFGVVVGEEVIAAGPEASTATIAVIKV